MSNHQLLALMPLLTLSLSAFVLMIQASIKRDQGIALKITALGLIVSLWAVDIASDYSQSTTLLVVDNWSLFFTALILLASLVILWLSSDKFASEGERKEEFYLLLVLSVLGAVVLIQSTHMVGLLLGMELMGVALYAMIAFPERGLLPLEAAIKYLVLSACASAILLFGFALIYAATGELSYTGIGDKIGSGLQQNPIVLMAGAAMVLAGLGFKLSVVPFHMWTPDVYEGAPTAITGYLATVSKGAVFVALTRLYMDGQLYLYESLTNALVVIALVSMLFGNWLALRQQNIKRLLAYSSIAHFGYLLVVLVAYAGALSASVVSPLIGQAITFYLVAYILTSLTAFAVVANVAGENQSKTEISEFEGLFWTRRIQACALTVAMLSLAGIPLTAGFIAKFYIINVSIESQLLLLLGTLLIASAIAIYYYLRVVFAMTKVSLQQVTSSGGSNLRTEDILALILLLSVLLLGTWPQPFIDLAGSL
jgi:NADH-quinone oxidoreductase subunit N